MRNTLISSRNRTNKGQLGVLQPMMLLSCTPSWRDLPVPPPVPPPGGPHSCPSLPPPSFQSCWPLPACVTLASHMLPPSVPDSLNEEIPDAEGHCDDNSCKKLPDTCDCFSGTPPCAGESHSTFSSSDRGVDLPFAPLGFWSNGLKNARSMWAETCLVRRCIPTC